MARLFLTPINLNKNELQNAVIQNLSGAPSSPKEGQVYYDSSTHILYFFNGNGWINAGGIGTGTYAGRPAAASSNANTFYYSTDRHLIYFSDGSTWQQVDDFGNVVTETTYGQASSNGTSNNYARADHTHGTPPLTTLEPTHITETTGSVGTGTAPAREDHVHNFTASNFPVSHFAVPDANTSWNSYKITNLADPTSAQDAATKNYVDGVAQGLNVHDQVRLATTTNIAGTYTPGTADASNGTGIGAYFTVTATGALTIDGKVAALNDRILLKNQTDGKQNGIYFVSTAGATGVNAVLTRATDSNNRVPGQVTAGDFVFVVEGDTQGSTGWTQISSGTASTPPGAIKIGTDSLSFSQFSGTGTYTASAGVLLTGTNFTLNPSTTGGLKTDATYAAIKLNTTASGLATTSSGLSVTPGLGITITGGGAAGAATNDQVAIDTDVVVRRYATTIGNGADTTIVVTHGLNTRDVHVTVMDAATYAEVFCDVVHSTVNTVSLLFSTAPSSNAYRVTVFG